MHMIEVTKIRFQHMPMGIFDKVGYDSAFEYYQVNQGAHVLGRFIEYDNEFHLNHKYINLVDETFFKLTLKSIIKIIRNYFDKPLQVMVDSNAEEIIDGLINNGFILKRQCFERAFQMASVIKLDSKLVDLHVFNKGAKAYDRGCSLAFDHYVKTHKDVNPFTAKKEHFIEFLPNKIICQIVDDKIVNLVFIDENELCYFASNNESQFEMFSHSVIRFMFERYQSITFEVDSTDELGLKFKSYFNDTSNDSFDTYVYK